MFRSMASGVSALSSSVANSHQTLHLGSSAPSKIPYGGFSPVRLQTRFEPRPPSHRRRAWLIGRHRSYLRVRRWFRRGTCVQAVPDASDLNHGSSGPWLPRRLYCPAGSSLTMATSAPLSATRRLMHSSARLRDWPASRRGSPIYSARPFFPCRRPYSGGPRDCIRRCLGRGFRLRRFRIGSATTSPTSSGTRGSFNEAAAFALCYGLEKLLAPLRPGLLRPSLPGPGRPEHPGRLSLDGSSSVTIAGLAPAGRAALWAAPERNEKRRKRRDSADGLLISIWN